MKSGEGTLIAFATGPGQTALDGEAGTNSPFTRALMANIATPGVEIQQAMTKVRAQVNEETSKGQLPWGHTNLIGTVYLNPSPAAARPRRRIRRSSRPVPLRKSNSNSGARSRTPTSRKNSTPISPIIRTAPSNRSRWPGSPRCRTARRPTTRALTTGVGIDPATFSEEASQITEDQLGLDRNQRRDVQRRLTGLGFDIKASGKFDDTTRTVITRWQAARGYPKSGYLNALQHKALQSEILATRVASASSDDSDDEPARPSRRHVAAEAAAVTIIAAVAAPARFFGGMMGGLFRR